MVWVESKKENLHIVAEYSDRNDHVYWTLLVIYSDLKAICLCIFATINKQI